MKTCPDCKVKLRGNSCPCGWEEKKSYFELPQCDVCGSKDVYVSMMDDNDKITRRYCKKDTTYRHPYEKFTEAYQERKAGFNVVPQSKADVEDILDMLYKSLNRRRLVVRELDNIDYNESEILTGRVVE